jgi:hypothetical protein
MKWFKHDADAHNDTRIKFLKKRYGLEGYGLYFSLLEYIADYAGKDNISDWGKLDPLYDSTTLAEEMGIDPQKYLDIVAYCIELGLFEVENEEIFCSKILSRLDEYAQKLKQRNGREPIKSKSGQSPDSVPTESGASRKNVALEEEREEEREEEYLLTPVVSTNSIAGEIPKKSGVEITTLTLLDPETFNPTQGLEVVMKNGHARNEGVVDPTVEDVQEGINFLKQLLRFGPKNPLPKEADNRKAFVRLFRLRGKENVFKVLIYARSVSGEKGFPVITNYMDLDQKWESLIVATTRKIGEKKPAGVDLST